MYDFEVVQHLAVKTHRRVRDTSIPALTREIASARKTLHNGAPWTPQQQGRTVACLADVSGAVEQLACLLTAFGDADDADARCIIAALRETQATCRALEADALNLLSRRA
jgi:hypothetical protein